MSDHLTRRPSPRLGRLLEPTQPNCEYARGSTLADLEVVTNNGASVLVDLALEVLLCLDALTLEGGVYDGLDVPMLEESVGFVAIGLGVGVRGSCSEAKGLACS